MKLKIILSFLILLIFFLITGCERKVINEASNDNNLNCFTCHGDDDFALIAAKGQWQKSVHASGNNIDRNRNYSSRYQTCEKCHTNEGFIANISGVAAAGDNFSAIGCFTCHAPHTNGTLAALRVEDAATLANGTVFDRDEANLCASCHQGRENADTYVVDNIKFTRFGPHYGTQADMLIGSNGYEYAGYEYDNSPHTNVATKGCLNCHMAPAIGYAVGGHTFNMYDSISGHENYNGCNVESCHDGEVDTLDYDGVQTEIEELLDSLGTILQNAGLLDSTLHATEGLTVSDKDSSGAVYNFLFVEYDRSEGVHNTEYAKGLLESSINFMNTGNPNEVAQHRWNNIAIAH
jgi:hypothetical protein